MSTKPIPGTAIILEDHTLGITLQGTFPHIQVLHTSILKGSSYDRLCGPIPIGNDWRQATEQDFIDFGVHWHPDYKVMMQI